VNDASNFGSFIPGLQKKVLKTQQYLWFIDGAFQLLIDCHTIAYTEKQPTQIVV
jgi:hypothetical protein